MATLRINCIQTTNKEKCLLLSLKPEFYILRDYGNSGLFFVERYVYVCELNWVLNI